MGTVTPSESLTCVSWHLLSQVIMGVGIRSSMNNVIVEDMYTDHGRLYVAMAEKLRDRADIHQPVVDSTSINGLDKYCLCAVSERSIRGAVSGNFLWSPLQTISEVYAPLYP